MISLDEKYMQRALSLATRGKKSTHPNPLVGAVLVRGGRTIAEGWHRAYGAPHAEVEVLRQAGMRARGATLYVTLEPCTHWGKTPPCADAICAAGIRRIVVAMRDPNPKARGGLALLRRHGLRVTVGVLEQKAREQNRVFLTWIEKNRPFVTLKAAATLDGRLATITGESQWITGPKARREGHRLRAGVDAVAVGAGTVLKDNPSLTSHGQGRNPVRIIFAGRRKLPRRARALNRSAPTWVLREPRGPVNVRRALAGLARRGISHLLVEGGPALHESFLKAGVVDEVVWFAAPVILGSQSRLKRAWRLTNVRLQRLGADAMIQGRLTI